MLITNEPTKIDLYADEYTDIRALQQQAIDDYDTFWASLSDRDRDLTGSLTCSDTLDTVLVFGDRVYEFVEIDQTGNFEVYEIGLESDFELYVNDELIGGDASAEQVEAFIAELQNSLPGLRIKSGQASNGCSSKLQWIADNRYVAQAWEAALDEI